jgi:cytochrome c6
MNLTRKRIFLLMAAVSISHATASFGPGARAADGTALFAKNCAACHGPDGKARSIMAKQLRVKDLSVSKLSDAEIAKQINEGSRNKRGDQIMPSFKDRLTEEEIQALIIAVKDFRK